MCLIKQTAIFFLLFAAACSNTSGNFARLNVINSDVYHSIEYETQKDAGLWMPPVCPQKGDCDDFAMCLMHKLKENKTAAQTALIVTRQHYKAGKYPHAVVLVEYENGERYMADPTHNKVFPADIYDETKFIAVCKKKDGKAPHCINSKGKKSWM